MQCVGEEGYPKAAVCVGMEGKGKNCKEIPCYQEAGGGEAFGDCKVTQGKVKKNKFQI